MAVNVFLSTTLRDSVPGYRPTDGLAVEVGAGTSAARLAETIGLPLGEIKIIMINGRHAKPDAPVRDGDRVGYFPAVGGG